MNWLRTYNHSHCDERQQPEHDLHRSRSHFHFNFVDIVWRESQREREWDPFCSQLRGATGKKPTLEKEILLHFIYLPTFLVIFWFSFLSNLCNICFSKPDDHVRTRNSKSPAPGPGVIEHADLNFSLPLSQVLLVFWGFEK